MNKVKAPEITIWSRTFICMMCCSTCTSLSQSIANPFVSTYTAFLGAGTTFVGFLTGLYFGVSVLLRPFSGPAIVFIDKKKILFFVFITATAVNLCYATFNNIPMFVMARILQGAQFSVAGSISITIASDSLPKEKLGTGLGIYGLGAAVSTAIGPAIGVALRSWGEAQFGQVGGFKCIFYAAALFPALALIPCALTQPKVRTKEELADSGKWYKNILALKCVPSATCNLLFAMSFSLFNAYMIPYAAERGFVGISVYFTIYSLGLLLSRPISGRLTDKIGAVRVLYISGCIFLFAFIIVSRANDIRWVYFAAVFSSLGYGGANPAFQTICMQSIPGARRGVASNTNYLGIDSGQFLGPLIGGFIISGFMHTGRAYSIMYLFAVVPVVCGLVVLTFTRKYIMRNLADAAANDT